MEVAARYKLLTLLFTVNTEGRFPEKTAVLLDFVQITWVAISKLSFREFLNDKIIFVQLVCSFRYGREVI